MNGILQLEGNPGISEPQFFSMSIDHAMACINVHWLSEKAESGTICFHVEKLLQYFIDVDGLKAVKRAVKNILDYGVSERPQKIYEGLDAYLQIVYCWEGGGHRSQSGFGTRAPTSGVAATDALVGEGKKCPLIGKPATRAANKDLGEDPNSAAYPNMAILN